MLNYELNIFISHLPGRIQDRIRSFLTRNSEKQLGCFHACMTMINIYFYPLPKSTATEIKNKCGFLFPNLSVNFLPNLRRFSRFFLKNVGTFFTLSCMWFRCSVWCTGSAVSPRYKLISM